MADKYLRNLTHLKMLLKLQSLIKRDFKTTHKVELEAWNKWTYVRNAIIHSGREVSADLTSIWRDRFPQLGDPLKLTDKDCTVVSSLAIKLGKIVDSGALENHIELSDGTLLVREFFIRDGIDDRRALSQKVQKILHLKIRPTEVDQALGFQRRTNGKIEGWKFSHHNFEE